MGVWGNVPVVFGLKLPLSKCITVPVIKVISPRLGLSIGPGLTRYILHWKWCPSTLELAFTSSLATLSPGCTSG